MKPQPTRRRRAAARSILVFASVLAFASARAAHAVPTTPAAPPKPAISAGAGTLAGQAAPASPATSTGPTPKRPAADGSLPRRLNLPKPPVTAHPDVAPAGAGGLIGDGSNLLSFSSFDDGDMVVVLGTTFGHAGIWSDALYSASQGLNSYCVWSANVTPRNGVQREQPAKYRAYDRGYGLWVPGKALYGKAVVDYCAAQSGEPYVITSSKTDTSAWYCSKLPWVGWRLKTGVDLDADGGYWVWPVDLVNDAQTAVFAMSD